uniref:C2H2-type domain-containing protein n=1 Tax=Ditylenchus dipsaci TaxID=166011 RepID=A0A915DZ95_9BILA
MWLALAIAKSSFSAPPLIPNTFPFALNNELLLQLLAFKISCLSPLLPCLAQTQPDKLETSALPSKPEKQVRFLRDKSTQTMKCPKCNWHYKYQESLEIHMKEKHGEEQNSPICLKLHPKLVDGESYTCGCHPYRCDLCQYTTSSKGNLAIHMKSVRHMQAARKRQSTKGLTSPYRRPTRSIHYLRGVAQLICYFPFFVTMLKPRFLELSCYKFMIFLGVMDFLTIATGSLISGYLLIEGAVFCTNPKLIYFTVQWA